MAPKIMSGCCAAEENIIAAIRPVTGWNTKGIGGGDGGKWEEYTLKDLMLATNNFADKNKLGEGGFGTVYHGRTRKGAHIAVKRLKVMTPKAEMEFAMEVEMLGRVAHDNLLSLRGFYAGAGGDERLIVYDYMPNGSIITHLYSDPDAVDALNWPRRMSIATGAAKGLSYLHNEVKPHIIHRDVKASNVLLDGDFRARVADFGFAKLLPDGVSHMTTVVKGTVGYLSPEYAMYGKLSPGSDVYSFGILLLELVSGRRPIVRHRDGKRSDIVSWAKTLVANGDVEGIADRRLDGWFDRAELRMAVALALHCAEGKTQDRPSMRDVVDVLRCGPVRKTAELGYWTSEEDDDAADIQKEEEKKKRAEKVRMTVTKAPSSRRLKSTLTFTAREEVSFCSPPSSSASTLTSSERI